MEGRVPALGFALAPPAPEAGGEAEAVDWGDFFAFLGMLEASRFLAGSPGPGPAGRGGQGGRALLGVRGKGFLIDVCRRGPAAQVTSAWASTAMSRFSHARLHAPRSSRIVFSAWKGGMAGRSDPDRVSAS